MSDAEPPYRVVQWATGNIGARALRHVIEHPELTLAGVYAHTPGKAGKDAGELCGLGPTGIVATGAVRERIEAACERGGTSIHSTGSSPGFITEALPLVLTSIQRRLDGLTISEFADLSQRDSPQMLFDVIGFGKPLEQFDARRLSYGRVSFGPSLQLVADALGVPLDT